MKLNAEEQAMLNGDFGEPRRWAIEHMLRVGRFFDAPDTLNLKIIKEQRNDKRISFDHGHNIEISNLYFIMEVNL